MRWPCRRPAGSQTFSALRRSIKGAPERLILFAFDLLQLDGQDLRGQPLIDRRRRLEDLIGAARWSTNVTMTTGILERSGSALSALSTDQPSTPGIMTSSRMDHGATVLIRDLTRCMALVDDPASIDMAHTQIAALTAEGATVSRAMRAGRH